jgi:hypothetical protein
MARSDDVSFLGEGPGVYGEVSRDTIAAIRFIAAQEGVYLDPIYGGHAMAALLRRDRRKAADRPLIFVQTGGAPTVFAYERELASRRILEYASLAPRVNRTAKSTRRAHRAGLKSRRPGGHHTRREVDR